MSNVVEFLEALSTETRGLSEREYAQAVEASGLDVATRQALLARDAVRLSAVSGVRTNVMAFIFPAEDEPDTERPDTDEPDREPKEGDHDPHGNALAA